MGRFFMRETCVFAGVLAIFENLLKKCWIAFDSDYYRADNRGVRQPTTGSHEDLRQGNER